MLRRPLLTALFAVLATLMVNDAARAESIPAMPCVCNDDCKPYGYGNCSSYGYCDDWGSGIPCPKKDMGPDGPKKDMGPDGPKMDRGPDVPKPPMTCRCNADCGSTDSYCSVWGFCSSKGPGVPCEPLDIGVPPMGDGGVIDPGTQAGSEPLDRGCRVGGEGSALGGLWLLVAALWFCRRRRRR